MPSQETKTNNPLEETAKKTEIATLLNTFERKMKSIGEKQAEHVFYSLSSLHMFKGSMSGILFNYMCLIFMLNV